MPNEPQTSKYVVDFFNAGNRGATPTDSMRLKADNDADAIAQAVWLARRTCCHFFQVRTVTRGVHSVVYKAVASARVA